MAGPFTPPPPHPVLPRLREQSTWRLLGLSLITYGVYAAYYCRRQTRRLNEHLAPERRISPALPLAVIVLNWVSLALLLVYFAVEPGHPVEDVSDLADLPAGISFIVWGFAARSRMNELLHARPKELEWFHGLWTFLLTPLYFNFKVNRLCDARAPGVAGTSAPG